tara:strand:- start:16784 stop:17050 length:267 start_codon:yes stop_codon:yes gene_type:complete
MPASTINHFLDQSRVQQSLQFTRKSVSRPDYGSAIPNQKGIEFFEGHLLVNTSVTSDANPARCRHDIQSIRKEFVSDDHDRLSPFDAR